MFDIATNILALLFVLGVLIFVHEFGHFFVAKAFGVGIEVFSLGFGKRLLGFRKGDTDYRISALPLGGYVKMVGENPEEEVTGADNEFLSKPKWQRFLVLVAGPVMNVALAFVFTVAVYQLGIRVLADADDPVVLGLIEPGTVAAASDLQVGDRIVSVDGDPMPNWEQFRLLILISANQPLTLGVVRNGYELEIPVTPAATGEQAVGRLGVYSVLPPEVGPVREGGVAEAAGLRRGDLIVAVDGESIGHYNPLFGKLSDRVGQGVTLTVERGSERFQVVLTPQLDEQGAVVIGFTPEPDRILKIRSYPLGEAIVRAGSEIKSQSMMLGEILKRLFTGRMSIKTLSGPIEIARFSGGAARTGDPSVLLQFMAFISLQLGILNLLPIPVLDGGQIALILFEGAIRRDLSLKVKERIMQVGLILIVSLMALVITLDVSKLIPDSWWDLLPF